MKVPNHVAIILDGNGRWAKRRGMPRNYGHVQGAKQVELICEKAYKMGIQYLTVYAFSTENWNRPRDEVDALMKLLRNYMKTAHPGIEISKPGYLKQRTKLNPLAFYELYRHHNRNFYTDPGFSTFHGYLVLAADGSGINIPTTKETLEEFGTSSRKGTKPQAAIGLGCLYDVMNRMVLESDCCRCKFDEMSLAEEQIDRVHETIGSSQPFLVVMDRGYPSTAAFIRMMEKGILFLARLKSSDYKKEQTNLTGPDTWVDIHLDKSRIRHYKGTDIGRRMEELGHITLRMVKVPLSEEREEVLITNLPSEIFDYQQMAEL